MSEKENIYLRAIRNFGMKIQCIIAMEELAELIQQLSKFIRYGSTDFSWNDFIYEVVDSEIMINQIKEIVKLNIKDFDILYKVLFNEKIKKLEKRIEFQERILFKHK